MNQTVPRFTSRRSALKYLSEYYKDPHWKQLRERVYLYWKGRCCKCGDLCALHTGWQVHHGEGTYDYLWKEDQVMDSMMLLHVSCHQEVEAQKKKARKAVRAAAKRQQAVHEQTKKYASRKTPLMMKKLKRVIGLD